MKYDFDRIINRAGTQAEKWDAPNFLLENNITQRIDKDTIPMFVADMDFESPEPVVRAVRERANDLMYGYSVYRADSRYTDAIVNWFSRRLDWHIQPEHIAYSPGTVNGLFALVRQLTNKGDGIIIQKPVYTPFIAAVLQNKRRVMDNHLINNDGYYTIDFEDLEKKASEPTTTMMILCNPHNPVGRIWSNEDLIRIAGICQKYQVILVADEIHGDLIRNDQTFTPIATLMDNHDQLITCTAVNKTFNLAGLAMANMVIPNEKYRKRFYADTRHAEPSVFGISALIAAYNEGEEWLEQLKTYLDGHVDYIADFLKTNLPKVKFVKPEGTYIAWMDFSAYGLTEAEIYERIYLKANVILQEGRRYSPQESLFQRMCFPTPKPLLEEALNRIAREFN